MIIQIVTPARPRSLKGNWVTAFRWKRLLQELGHRVHLGGNHSGKACDLLIALHARHSHRSIVEFRRRQPNQPLVLVLTGTDLYLDLADQRQVSESLELATRLVVLQPKAKEVLPGHLQLRTRVIYQSVRLPSRLPARSRKWFQVCVLGHLRPVKDPFRAPLASLLLPAHSKVRIVHPGRALSPEMAREAESHQDANPRYRWLGGLPRWKALRCLAASHLHVLSSEAEGGANALGEAIACGVPSLLSRIPGSEGIVGEDYPGFFSVHATEELAGLLDRSERDEKFYNSLRRHTIDLQFLFQPEREKGSLASLLAEMMA